jgi:Fe-S-cluster-containing dehydrogenase component/DMSO reductase anchor subunit
MMETALSETRTLIDQLLAEQQRLTAVELFARRHELDALPTQSAHYRELLPARPPVAGEQYAFEVNLDACSGCKACVTACHNLNGLEDEESWRNVGLLHGGSETEPFQQTVTTSCHHCLEPACLEGCPVLAYEKNPVTGIVRHLDDQCIGCQYCILKCPYDVPKYSSSRGIVRKCDMCAGRLAVGEAPACAQACPNGAIRITVVSRASIKADASEGVFLPGSPDPSYTQPTTRYLSRRGLPGGLEPGDAHIRRPAPSHPSLIGMLVLTQLSVGAYCVESLLRALYQNNLMTRLSAVHSLTALGAGLLALGTSTLHLGRPLAAWRAVIGLRRSWLSREIIIFGLFAGLALVQACGFWLSPLHAFNSAGFGLLVDVCGMAGVFSSVMIYHDTRRVFWRAVPVGFKFFGTTILLGAAVILFVTTLQGLLYPAVAANGTYQQLTAFLSKWLITVSALKLAMEVSVFRHLLQKHSASMKETALLLSGELAEISTARFLAGAIGGVLLPMAFLVQRPAPGIATLGVTIWMMLFVILGELLERYLFFTAVVPERMPGGFNA